MNAAQVDPKSMPVLVDFARYRLYTSSCRSFWMSEGRRNLFQDHGNEKLFATLAFLADLCFGKRRCQAERVDLFRPTSLKVPRFSIFTCSFLLSFLQFHFNLLFSFTKTF
ncbi:hypothetical protein T439DRAFT_329854 [Meredithblackwellia eburnea MCA 4105]